MTAADYPSDDVREDKIPAGARILKIVLDFDKAVTGGIESEKVLLDMSKKSGFYDPFSLLAEKKFLQTEKTRKSFVNKELS